MVDKKFIYCNIYWNFIFDYNDKNMFNVLFEEYDILKLLNKYYLLYVLILNEFYL